MSRNVKRAYKFRFYPTPEQEHLLRRTFGCVRVVYNHALETRTRSWRMDKKSVGFAETSRNLTQLKKNPDYTWLGDVSSVPLQQALRHLNDGFTRFFSKQNGYPRFKTRKDRQSATFVNTGFTYTDGKLTLAKMREPLDVRWSRNLPEGCTVSSVTVSLDRAGRWFVSLLTDTVVEPLPTVYSSVGVDMGLEHFATLSDGTKIDNPRFSRSDHARIERAQRNLSRKQKGSKNRAKARMKVARAHARVTDRRTDFLHKLSTQLVHENQVIVVEDLNVKGMSAKGRGSRKKGLNRSIHDAGWAQFREMLTYKAHWYGRELVVVNRWFPSSQLCSECHVNSGKKPLHVREWTCTNCGTLHDRDINAAKNILAAGLAVSVCGDGVRLTDTPVLVSNCR
ncbi:MAG: transposase [Spirochaetes bacterium]|nr:MAG: transposase [Spirochaetota bacterium]